MRVKIYKIENKKGDIFTDTEKIKMFVKNPTSNSYGNTSKILEKGIIS